MLGRVLLKILTCKLEDNGWDDVGDVDCHLEDNVWVILEDPDWQPGGYYVG